MCPHCLPSVLSASQYLQRDTGDFQCMRLDVRPQRWCLSRVKRGGESRALIQTLESQRQVDLWEFEASLR